MTSPNPSGEQLPYTELIPRPDPSKLTTEAVDRATAQFRREMSGLQEVFEARLARSDGERTLLLHGISETVEALRGEAAAGREALRDITGARLDALDRALTLAAAELDRKLAAEREYVMAQIDIRGATSAERYSAIQEQFTANKTAVEAALASAKEAVAQQDKSNSLSITKSEEGVKEQLASLGQVSDTRFAAQEDKITDARDRITAIESITRGIEQAGGKTREEKQLEHGERGLQNSGAQLALFSVAILVSVVAVIVSILLHH